MGKEKENRNGKTKGNAIALMPIGVFLVLYLGLGILFEYVMKIPMGFYNVPIVVAFLAAILVACLQNRAVNFEQKLEIMSGGVGDKNIITMLLIFLAAGSFVGVVGRGSAESVAYCMLSLIPARYAVAVLFVVACFATCGGSTGGGMKMLRVVMLVKYTSLQLVTTAQPRVVRPMVLNGQVLADKTVLSALSFMLLWLATTVLAFLGLLLTGLDATTAFGAVLGCICNIGPGLGAVGPNANFSVLTDAQLWLCTFCMLIGRLELVTVFVLFTRSFWRA